MGLKLNMQEGVRATLVVNGQGELHGGFGSWYNYSEFCRHWFTAISVVEADPGR